MAAKTLFAIICLLIHATSEAQSTDEHKYFVEGFTSYVLTEGSHNDTPWVVRHWEFDTSGRLIHEISSKSNHMADMMLPQEHYAYG